MKIEEGWNFYSADFSVQASGKQNAVGSVTLVRSPDDREKWNKLPDAVKEYDKSPELYVTGRGLTLEDALINANLAAAHALPIPDVLTVDVENPCISCGMEWDIIEDSECPHCGNEVPF